LSTIQYGLASVPLALWSKVSLHPNGSIRYLPRFPQRRAFKWAIVPLNVRVDEVICPQARCHRRPDAISVATASDFTGFIRFVLEYLGFVFVHDDAPPWAFRRLTNGVGSGRTNNNVRTDWVRSWPSRCQQTFKTFSFGH
jgi:hypothetical protein